MVENGFKKQQFPFNSRDSDSAWCKMSLKCEDERRVKKIIMEWGTEKKGQHNKSTPPPQLRYGISL